MRRKHIFGALAFLCAALLLFAAALWQQKQSQAGLVRGIFAFAQTRSNIRLLAKVKMITADSGEINIYRRGEDWYFSEAKDYFVNVHQLAEFYNMVNNSLIENVFPAEPEALKGKMLDPETGTKIITYDTKDNVLDEMVIGKHSVGASSYAYNPRNPEYYYIISNVGAFSGEAEGWIPYPLLTVDARLIKSLKTAKTVYTQEQIQKSVTVNPDIQRVLGVLSFIGYDGISAKSELLSDEAQNIEPHEIEVTMAGGLIYAFSIYKIEDLYWLGITLKADRIAYKDVPTFVENNQKYFADWLFLMSMRQGQILYNL